MSIFSGAGNVFLLVDNRQKDFPLIKIPMLCEQNKVDGCILAETSTHADAFMRTINRDGSEAQMCGNGLRCFTAFLRSIGLHRKIYTIETLAGIHKTWFEQDQVCAQFPKPSGLKLHLQENLHFLNTGVPHAVRFVDSIENIDVETEGKRLHDLPCFAPERANINFVSLKGSNSLSVRTYERGVGAETLACGTGATASALIAHLLYGFSSPIDVLVRSNEHLKITFKPEFCDLTLQGPVQFQFEV